MSIQLAHFFTTDSWLTFFVTLCLLACVKAADRGTTRWFAVAGATLGLAMATKGSVFALGGPCGHRSCLRSLPPLARIRAAGGPSCHRAPMPPQPLVAAAVAFFAFEPYALLRP